MTRIAYEFAAGWPFFLAAALLLAGLALRSASKKRLPGLIAAAAIALGLALLIVAWPPLSLPFMAVVVGGVLVGLVVLYTPLRRRRPLRAVAVGAAAVLLGAAVVTEARWHIDPPATSGRWTTVLIVGDSVAAGTGGIHESTWPRRLAGRKQIEVVDASIAGARVADATRLQVPALADRGGLVLLEIGGNDLLMSIPIDRFESDLVALFTAVAAPGRSLIMFELPTLPGRVSYVRIQRQVAQDHDVLLIPRRRFMSVLRDPANTVDGVHLSNAGQEAMVRMVAEVLSPHLEAAEAERYEKVHPRP